MSYTPLPALTTGADISPDAWNADIRANFEAGIPGLYQAKGDLAVGTGADAMSRVAVGTNTQIFSNGGWSWGFVPIGGIILWSGALGSLPSNWALCNGSNGTPDLRNKFVIGAGGSYSVGATGGASTVSLQHTHTETTGAAGSHGHTQANATADTAHTHTESIGVDTATATPNFSGFDAALAGHDHGGSLTSAGGSSHTHSNPDTDAATHTHTATLDNQLSTTQDIRPPFYQLAYIMRTS